MSDLSTAAEETKRLSAALEEAKGKLKGLKEAQQDLSVSNEKNAAATMALRKQAIDQTREVERATAALKEHEQAQMGAAEAAAGLAEKSARVSELFAKGFSDELPEKVKDAREAFELLGDSQLKTGEKAKALGAGLSIGKQVIAGYAGAVTGAADSLVQMSNAAREAEVRLERQREIAGSLGAAMGAVSQATGGAASQSDAWAARTALLNAGLRVSATELAAVVEGARRHREAGESNAESIERVVAAIRGEETAQQRIGIVTRANADAHGRLTEVVARLTDEQRRQGTVAETAAEQQARQTTNIQRAQDSLLAGANELFNPVHNLLTAGGAVVDIFDRGQAAAQRWRTGAETTARATTALGDSVEQTKERIRAATNAQNDAAQAIDAMKSKTDAARASQEEWNQTVIAGVQHIKELQRQALASPNFQAQGRETHTEALVRNALAGAQAYEQQQRSRRLQTESRDLLMRTHGLSREQANQGLGITETAAPDRSAHYQLVESLNALTDQMRTARVGTGSNDRMDYSATGRQLAAFFQQQLGTLTGAGASIPGRRPGEHDEAYLQRVLGNATAGVTAADAARRAREERERGKREAQVEANRAAFAADQERERDQRSMQLGNYDTQEGLRGKASESASLQEQYDGERNFGRQLAGQFATTETAAQRAASGVKGAFDIMTGAITSHVDALISGREEAGEAFLGMAADATKAIALQAVPKAIFSTAEGFAALATQRYDAAVQAFTAAGIYTAVAVGFGAGAAGLGAVQASQAQAKQPSGSSQGAQSYPARGTDYGSDRGGTTIVQYNFNGLVTETQAAHSLKRVLDRGDRSGVRPNFAERRG